MSDDQEDEFTAKKTKMSGVRGRRGFSKKKSTEQDKKDEISESSAVFTTRVTKCFNNLAHNKIDDEIIRHALADNTDVEEEDSFCTKKVSNCDKPKGPKKKQTESLSYEELLELSDDEDDQPITIGNELSRSPTPPPEPAEVKLAPAKNRRLKRNVKKAVASLTQSLLAAENQLKESLNANTPDKDIYVIDDDEDDLTVRVDIMGKIHRFLMNSEEPFSVLIAKIAKQEKEEMKNVMLVHNDRTIRSSDSPKSVGMRTVDIVTCHIQSNCNDSFNDSLSFDPDDANLIEIVIQSRVSRHKEIVKAHPDKPLKTVMKQYSVRINKDLSCMKFWFDGEIITGSSVPSDLDMEDGDVLDVQFL